MFSLRLLRRLVRLLTWLLVAVVVYLAVTAVQVWLTGQKYEPRRADAIVVMGAAQYDGTPTNVFASRLDEANLLWDQGDATTVMVTGGKEKGDAYTEAEAGAAFLEARGVPARDILEAGGNDSWANLSDAAAELVPRGMTSVLMVTDKFHEDRSMAIASDVGLMPYPTPTLSSPIQRFSAIPFYGKETVAVALGRIVGYSHLPNSPIILR